MEEECLKILALYQPVAGDLRFVVAVIKINSELERIGDLAANIGERARAARRRVPPVPMPRGAAGHGRPRPGSSSRRRSTRSCARTP